jgi:hypothetical protein
MSFASLVRVTLLTLAAALILGGCGDSEGGTSSTPGIDAFARFFAADSPVISYVDLAEVRDQLGLPADADSLDFAALKNEDTDDPGPDAQLIEAAIIGMPSLTSFVQTLQEDPASQQFDGSQIDAAANTLGDDGPLTVVHTSQPFGDIADGLKELGYRPEGNLLTKEGERIEQVADAGDGFVLIGRNTAPRDAVEAQAGAPDDLLSLLEPADQPIQQAATGAPGNCVTALGGWENAQTTEGVLAFKVNGGADAEAFDTTQLERSLGLEAEEPTTDGDTAQIAFTSDEQGGPPGSRVRVMLTRFATGYDCG